MFFKKNLAFIFVLLAFQSVVLQASQLSEEKPRIKDRKEQKGVIAWVKQHATFEETVLFIAACVASRWVYHLAINPEVDSEGNFAGNGG